VRTVAIVGAGIGSEHAAAYLELSDRYRVHTICDLDLVRAQALADKCPGALVSDNFDLLLEDPGIDIVDICLPPHLHHEVILRAVRCEKVVICEKPLVCSLAEADAIISTVNSLGAAVFPVFQYRYGRAAAQLRALEHADLTGKAFIASLETHWSRHASYYQVPWRGTWQGEQGGAVLTHAIHSHDWLMSVLGPVKSVYARLATRVNTIEVEDCAALSIEMESGALVTSSITLGAADNTSRLRFSFEKLTAQSGSNPYAPAADTWTFIARNPADQAQVDEMVNATYNQPSGYSGLFSAIADTLDGQVDRTVSLNDARRALEFVSAVYTSNSLDKSITLPITKTDACYQSWMPLTTSSA